VGRLDGKIALITGTGGAQGRAAAMLFACEGAGVVGGDINESPTTQTLQLVRKAGGRKYGDRRRLNDSDLNRAHRSSQHTECDRAPLILTRRKRLARVQFTAATTERRHMLESVKKEKSRWHTT
jgi:NAD(P)-dependent dehydrogenase (short-subunit alcohol dehydrogenase family)